MSLRGFATGRTPPGRQGRRVDVLSAPGVLDLPDAARWESWLRRSTRCAPRPGCASPGATPGSPRSRWRRRSTWPSATAGSTGSARRTTASRSSSATAPPAGEHVVEGQRGEGRGALRGRTDAAGRAGGGRGREGGRTVGGGERVAAPRHGPAGPRGPLEASAPAQAAFERLGRSERYAVILPLLKARTPETRAKTLARAVARLAAQCELDPWSWLDDGTRCRWPLFDAGHEHPLGQLTRLQEGPHGCYSQWRCALHRVPVDPGADSKGRPPSARRAPWPSSSARR